MCTDMWENVNEIEKSYQVFGIREKKKQIKLNSSGWNPTLIERAVRQRREDRREEDRIDKNKKKNDIARIQ